LRVVKRVALVVGAWLVAASCAPGSPSSSATPAATGASGLQKIQHIVVIMQENRSFDEYFGL